MQQQTFADVSFERHRTPPPGAVSRRDELRRAVGETAAAIALVYPKAEGPGRSARGR